jgi:hypothetical protein
LGTINKELLAIEFKRTRDARSNYVEKAIAVAQEQYTSLLTGLLLESKWDLIRQKLVRCQHEEQDKVLRSYFAQKGGKRSQRGEGIQGKGREHVKWDMYA